MLLVCDDVEFRDEEKARYASSGTLERCANTGFVSVAPSLGTTSSATLENDVLVELCKTGAVDVRVE